MERKKITMMEEVFCIYIGMLVVKPELQKLGIGKFILNVAESYSKSEWETINKKQTIKHFEMTVIKQRKELIAWYVKRGYFLTNKYLPFPYGEERFGIPKVDDLEFVVMIKENAWKIL